MKFSYSLRCIITLLTVILLLYNNISSAQTCNFELSPILKTKISKINKNFKVSMKRESAQKIISQLDSLKLQEDHWIISFWKALVYSSVNSAESIDLALDQISLLEKRINTPSDCVTAALFGLQSHIYNRKAFFLIRKGNKIDYDKFRSISRKLLDFAISNRSNNPSLLIMSALTSFTNPQDSHKKLLLLATLNQAKNLANQQLEEDIHLLENWNLSLTNRWIPIIKNQLSPNNSLSNLSEFKIKEANKVIENFQWVLLLSDKLGDGANPNSADGKSLHYYYDKKNKRVWFKLEQYNDISTDFPAVSISFDNDSNTTNGVPWYGSNKKFMVDGMISVGTVQKKWKSFLGYNGFTDAEGIKTRNWLNGERGIVNFYVSKEKKSYYISLSKKYFGDVDSLRLIGSVGANALWNDDIGDEKIATVKF